MKKSAGILLFKKTDRFPELFLVHPGGPFWKNKEVGAWSIPKGEFEEDEDPLMTAIREFKEETGQEVSGNFLQLKTIQQKGGKMIYAWAVEGDINPLDIVSNNFKMEWPYKSGKYQEFPEVDKAGWFSAEDAKKMINPAQAALIDDLIDILQKS